MRFSNTAVLALPLLVAGQGAFEQYKAQFQNFLGSFGGAAPSPSTEEAGVPRAHAEHMKVLTLDNWKQTLFEPVAPGATVPEEWWVLVSGRNKTCFGHCLTVEAAFNETAAKNAKASQPAHMAYVNCDDQPVLCNSWSAGPNTLWVFEMLPPPAEIDIYLRRLNYTTTTAEDIQKFMAQDHKNNFHKHGGYFHPFDGPLAKNGFAVPIGYFFYYFNAVPSWAVMLVLSFLSRSMMNRRANNRMAGAAPRGAPPGDGRS